MTDDAIYDRIGTGYAAGRRPDPRWQEQIDDAVGDAQTVLNVGAGTGSYEPSGATVVAVEPSTVMIAQRPSGSAPCVRAVAEHLPFPDGAFDVATAIVTVHHWTDLAAGIAELKRVARRQVVLTYDARLHAEFWLTDYIPEIADHELGRVPAIEKLTELLDTDDVVELPVPSDMRDGVLVANWCRPEAYLDPRVRACCSGLVQLDPEVVDAGIARLRDDLADGTWNRRYPGLRSQTDYDGGFRLLRAGLSSDHG